jgi:hypothetical protein
MQLRMSEIDSACIREWIIGNRLDGTAKKVFYFPTCIQLDLGSALHYHLQNSESYFGDSLYGFWYCLACGRRRRFGIRPTENCEYCGAKPKATVYDEYMFRLSGDAPVYVVGKIDLILKVDGKFRFGEIKTYSGDIKKFADGAHAMQLSGYIDFHRYDKSETKLPITIDRSVGYLIYVSKKQAGKDTVLSFPVRPTAASLTPVREKASAFTLGVREGILTEPLQPCINAKWEAGRAKTCPMSLHCKKLYQTKTKNIVDYISRGDYKA